MRYKYKLWNKAHTIDWYNAQPEEIKRDVYIEQSLGANNKSNVHLCIKATPHRTIVARIGKRGLTWFQLQPLQSPFINEKYFTVAGIIN